MRIPFSKVYRAFPELDRFNDAECQAYSRYVRQRFADRLLLMWIVAVPAALVLAIAMASIGTDVAIDLNRAAGLQRFGTWESVVIVMAWFVCMLLAGLGVLVVRDRVLRSILRSQLKGVRCEGCAYTLLGIPVVAHVVVCPECGLALDIRSRGLTPRDFDIANDALPGTSPDAMAEQALRGHVAEIALDPAHKDQLLSAVRERREQLVQRGAPREDGTRPDDAREAAP